QEFLQSLMIALMDYSCSVQESASLTMTVTDKGNGTCSYSMELKVRTDETALKIGASGTASSSSVNAKFHVRNDFEEVFNAATTIQSTTTKPQTVPENQDTSLELEELPGIYT